MARRRNTVFDGRVQYVDASTASYSGILTVHLDTSGLLVDDLFKLADAAQEALKGHVETVNLDVARTGTTMALAMAVTNEWGHYTSDDRRKAIIAILNPRYVRRVSAQATIVRNDSMHTATRITITVESGDNFDGVRASQFNGKHGVLRARVGDNAQSFIFTMVQPVDTDEGGAITRAVKVVATKLDALLVTPVVVNDNNPDARLDPANDYAPGELIGI